MKGTSLIEALLALMLMAVTGAAVVLLLSQIASVNNSAKLRGQATSYTEQGLEQSRSFLQTYGWVNLAAKGNSSGLCYSDGTLVNGTSCITGCGTGGTLISSPVYPASFTRSVKVTTNAVLGSAAIVSTVCWLEKGRWNKSEAVTYHYNY